MAVHAWQDLKTTDFNNVNDQATIAMLPISATEQHGPHLPVGTDAMILNAVLDALASQPTADLDLWVLPHQCIGESTEHLSFPGTLSFDADLLLRIWFNIAAAAHRSGVRKLLIVNSHGGQGSLAEVVALQARQRLGMVAVVANTYRLGEPEGLIGAAEKRFGLHGGCIETSIMLACRPTLVGRSKMADFPSEETSLVERSERLSHVGDVRLSWLAEDLNPAGVTGDAAGATPDLGHALLAHMVSALIAIVRDMRALPLP
ncbi:MAG: creatininase family protein [Geminicoccaceae bacterium]